MKDHRRGLVFFFVCFGVGAAAFWVFRDAAPAPAAVRAESRLPQASPSPGVALSATAEAPTAVIETSARLRPVAAETRPGGGWDAARYFPELVEPVRNWRDFNPEQLTVAAYPGLPITFTRVAVKEEGRHLTWIGRSPDWPGAFYVGVGTADGYDGILVVPGASQFGFHQHGAGMIMLETEPGEDSCGVLPAQAPRKTPAAGAAGLQRALADPAPFEILELASLEAPAAFSDVLILYDAKAREAAARIFPDAAGYIDGRAKAMLESCNVVLEQSGVTAFRWRYLAALEAPAYSRTGILRDDLRHLSPGGEIGDWVAARRHEYSADQVLLLTGGSSDAGGWANIAARQVPVSGPLAIAVMRLERSYRLLAHELAHNFGCRHDRANFDGAGVGTPEGDGFWCYGLLWNDPPDPAGGPATTSGTIMSYADYIVPYFSNPNITLEVTTALESRGGPDRPLGTVTIGYAETHPKAAYNTRVLNDNAAAIYRINAEQTPPVIMVAPQGTTVTEGQRLSLSVVAEGNGLLYQWSKDGVALAGATGSTYTRTAAATGDAGNYTVQVRNRLGSVASGPAEVTVTARPQMPPPSGGGGGGGGGGAVSWPFTGLMAVLLVVAAHRRRA